VQRYPWRGVQSISLALSAFGVFSLLVRTLLPQPFPIFIFKGPAFKLSTLSDTPDNTRLNEKFRTGNVISYHRWHPSLRTATLCSLSLENGCHGLILLSHMVRPLDIIFLATLKLLTVTNSCIYKRTYRRRVTTLPQDRSE
jgi:hypothetical protein